jgi:nitrogenase molybdenum-iron protein alpha chain
MDLAINNPVWGLFDPPWKQKERVPFLEAAE